MASDTVNRQEYSARKGERMETVKPKDSDILKGDGSFVTETDNSVEFIAKRGDRYEAVKQGSSDIWKVSSHSCSERCCCCSALHHHVSSVEEGLPNPTCNYANQTIS